jgi:ABC-type transporter Mla subunit MlaD
MKTQALRFGAGLIGLATLAVLFVGPPHPLSPGTGTPVVAQAPAPPAAQPVPGLEATLKELNKTLDRFNKLAPEMEQTIREYRELAKEARAALPDARRMATSIQSAAGSWGRFGEGLLILVELMKNRLPKAMDALDETMTRMTKIFSEENQRNASEAMKNLRAGTAGLENAMKNVDQVARDSRVVLQNLNQSATKANAVLDNLQQATRPWAEASGSIVRSLDEGAANLSKLLIEVRQLFRVFGEGDGTLKALLSDTNLYNSVSDALCMITRILPRADRVLRDMEIFADKVSRHPEVLGASGLFRPSSGLKK